MIAAGEAVRPSPASRRPQGSELRHHFGVRSQRRAAALQGHGRIQPAVRAGHALPGRSRRSVSGRHHDITRTVPIGEPTAEMIDRFTRVLQGISPSPRQPSPRGRAARSWTVLPAVRCGKRVATLPMAPATASAPSWRCMRARSGLRRRQLAVGRRRASAGRHDHFQRARLLQAGRMRHPHREPWCWWSISRSPGGDKETLGFET